MSRTFQVSTKEDAVNTMAQLLREWSSESAFTKLSDEACDSKQSVIETSKRISSNLLNSLKTRK